MTDADRSGRMDGKRAEVQTRFVVTREFGGTQTMREVFEQLIEKRTEEHILRNMPHTVKNGQTGF